MEVLAIVLINSYQTFYFLLFQFAAFYQYRFRLTEDCYYFIGNEIEEGIWEESFPSQKSTVFISIISG